MHRPAVQHGVVGAPNRGRVVGGHGGDRAAPPAAAHPGWSHAELATRLPSSASEAFGTPFGELLEAANWNFYDIDPMLFSPAAATLTSTESGRAHHGGGLAPEVLERSFTG
ncbi:MAG: hypothetical protein JO262_15765 [Solirubrobacterales bacterium]|nr:hypothetical protein [Solirubrobacterales bacterium]